MEKDGFFCFHGANSTKGKKEQHLDLKNTEFKRKTRPLPVNNCTVKTAQRPSTLDSRPQSDRMGLIACYVTCQAVAMVICAGPPPLGETDPPQFAAT